MSSKYVRDEILSFVTTNFPAENEIDITAEYREMDDFLDFYGLTWDSNWLGLQFVGETETPITIPATNNSGKYREIGVIFLHIVEPTSALAYDNALNRSEAIRNAFRGQRINDIVIEEVSPPSFDTSATLQFQKGFTACAVTVNYYRDLDL